MCYLVLSTSWFPHHTYLTIVRIKGKNFSEEEEIPKQINKMMLDNAMKKIKQGDMIENDCNRKQSDDLERVFREVPSKEMTIVLKAKGQE